MKYCVLSYLELRSRKQLIKEQNTDIDVGSLYNYLENTLGFQVQMCLSLNCDTNRLSKLVVVFVIQMLLTHEENDEFPDSLR